jgi:hypothetical protein
MSDLTAGRALDALVAEKVMGINLEPHGNRTEPEHYSTEIGAAWKIVTAMRDKRWSFRCGTNADAPDQNAAAFVQAFRGLGHHILTGDYIERDDALVVAGSIPLAICLAALKVVSR